MSATILACKTISDELILALQATGCTHPVCWVDSNLHRKPGKLKEEIQSIISRISNVETIILAFGLCGNALVGLRSDTARLVAPKTEDCISLLLGSQKRRAELTRESASYYLTKGWLESENSIADEYDDCLKRFGRRKGRRLMLTIFKEYRCLSFVETGAGDSIPYIAKSERVARDLGLVHQVIEGSSRLLEKLLVGPWNDEFIVVHPGCFIELEHFLTAASEVAELRQ